MAGRRCGSRLVCAVAAVAAVVGCDGSGRDAAQPGDAPDVPPAVNPFTPLPVPTVPPTPQQETLPRACADLYDEDTLPTYEVEISSADWAAIQEDFVQGEEVYYPVVFRHGTEVVTNAMMRLRGYKSSCGEKMQFAISFNQIDPGGRFHGLRRIDLDHGGCRLMHERLALAYFRDLGVPAPCANNARLVVNGTYYGLFVNVEHVNKDFLKRNFGTDHEGDLWKSGWTLKTNEATPDPSRLKTYKAATDVATLASLTDLEEAVLEWAAEAVLPARDNYWLRGWNYYLYDHPTRGFVFIPYDMDATFGEGTWITEPIMPDALQHTAEIALADLAWRARFDDAVRRAVAAYDPARFEARLDRWWPQISAAAAADPHQVYTESRISDLRAQIRARADHLRSVVDDPTAW